MSRTLRAALAVVVALVGAACGELTEPAAATVGDEKITIEEIDRVVDRHRASPAFRQAAQQGDSDQVARQFEQSYLTRLIRRAVLVPEAAELGIEVTDADVDQRLEQIEQDLEAQGSTLEDVIEQQGLTLELVRQFVRDDELEQRLRAEVTKGSLPSDEELEAEYERRRDELTETEVQHILVEDGRLARDIVIQLRNAQQRFGDDSKKVDQLFAKLAEKHSTDPGSARRGGNLGTFRPGQFVAEFENAAAQLEPGEISDPVRSEFGWHVIRVLGRETDAFEDVRAQLSEDLAGARAESEWSNWLEDVFGAADVEVNPRFGEFDESTGQVVDADAGSLPGAATPAQPSPSPAPAPTPGG
ncbi:MAG TPA: peptidylprolyl isomerase [Actinomycetota bacterium]|nr:peptidylprolyl isomerase [Actinomycetota bacterium]